MKILESLLRYKFDLIFISFLDKYSHFRLLKHLKKLNECVANPKKDTIEPALRYTILRCITVLNSRHGFQSVFFVLLF